MLRPIFMINGLLLTILSVAMLVPALWDVLVQDKDWQSFLLASFITGTIGVCLYLTNRCETKNFNVKLVFLLTTTSWLVIAAFSALPFVFTLNKLSYTDAFFEAVSGITTTGSTVMVDLENTPPGILLWRALLQWLGGIGIIVVAIALLPVMRVGGMQLFRTESSDKSNKILPRATQIAGATSLIYIILTGLCTIALWMSNVDLFDAMCHAMATVATGGFSNHDQSVAYYNSPVIEAILVLFMLAGGIPFILYIQMLSGRISALLKDEQVQGFIGLVFISSALIILWLHFHHEMGWYSAFRYGVFTVVSIITTTGFVTTDYNVWGHFAITFLFLISVTGGCTGSSSGGIKIFRYQILYETAKKQIYQLIQPHGIFRIHYNQQYIPETILESVKSFFILFAFCFLVLATLLSLTGLDFLGSMSAAATALANVGPALGNTLGPTQTFATLTDPAKWLLAFGMLLGRLEIFTILVLFSLHFWKD